MMEIGSNRCDQVVEGDAVRFISDHLIDEVKSYDNWIGVQGDGAGTATGMSIVQTLAPIRNFHSRDDVFYGWRGTAILMSGIRSDTKSRVIIDRSDFYYPGKPAVTNRVDVSAVDGTDDCEIIDASFSGDRLCFGLQKWV